MTTCRYGALFGHSIATYQKDLNNIYNALVEEISAYQFESIDEKNSVNLEIQAN